MPEGVSFEHILVLATSVACGHCANTARAIQELCSVQAQRMHDESRYHLQVNIAELEKSGTMTDPAMARLMLEGPKELKAITVNGQIIVETEDDRERCQNTHF